MKDIRVGEYKKVSLPGETPWVEVLSISDSSFIGRIDNTLYRQLSEIEKARFLKDNFNTVEPIPELHSYKRDDVIEFIESERRYIPLHRVGIGV